MEFGSRNAEVGKRQSASSMAHSVKTGDRGWKNSEVGSGDAEVGKRQNELSIVHSVKAEARK